MKRISTILLAAFAIAISSSQAQISYSGGGATYGPYSRVVLPAVPSSLDFAGETVPLQNQDTRESLQRELLVTLNMHSRTFITLLNTKRYFAIIEPIMAKHGIPDDFKYLAMAESGLSPDVVSSAGAAGLWQIMSATGKSYGLSVGGGVDERYDIEKSTEVACKYLLASYRRFGSWTLAAAAYNAGDAGVQRRMDKQGTSSYYDSFYPEETMRYVFRILSFKILLSDPGFYGYVVAPGEYYPPLTDYHTVTVNDAKIDWSQVARNNGTTYKMLRRLNHWIRDYEYTNTARKVFTVKIPNEGFRIAVEDNVIPDDLLLDSVASAAF